MGVAIARKRREDWFGRISRAGEGHHRHDDRLAMRLRRQERHRGRNHHVGDGRELVRRSVGLLDERGDRLGGRGQDQDAAHDRAQLLQPVLEPGGDAEVAATAADCPEQIRVRLGVDEQDLAVGGHDLGREQRVDREAVLPGEKADAAAEGDPADADGARVAEPGRQSMGAGRIGVLPRRQPGPRPRGATFDVDLDSAHVPEVDHDAAVRDAVPHRTVAAATDCELQAALGGEQDGAGNVGGVGGPDDNGRPPVDVAADHQAGRVVFGAVRRDQPVVKRGAEVWNREGGVGRGHPNILPADTDTKRADNHVG